MDPGIDQLHRDFAAAMARGDLEAVLGMLTADYVLFSPGRPPVQGREALRGMMAAAFEAYHIEAIFESIEQLVSGDLAVEVGIDRQRARPRAGGEVTDRQQRVCLVLRRGDDGRWRYARGMSQAGVDS